MSPHYPNGDSLITHSVMCNPLVPAFLHVRVRARSHPHVSLSLSYLSPASASRSCTACRTSCLSTHTHTHAKTNTHIHTHTSTRAVRQLPQYSSSPNIGLSSSLPVPPIHPHPSTRVHTHREEPWRDEHTPGRRHEDTASPISICQQSHPHPHLHMRMRHAHAPTPTHRIAADELSLAAAALQAVIVLLGFREWEGSQWRMGG